MRKKEIAKKIMAVLMVFAMLVTGINIAQPQTVEAAAKNRIVLENKYKTLYVGESYTMKASAFYKDGKLQASKKKNYDTRLLAYKYFRFSSSNNKVASVSKKGVVKAKKKGTVTLTMTHIYDHRIKTSVKMQVKAKKKGKITLAQKAATIGVGNTVKISVKSVKNMGGKAMKYTTSDKSIATVSDKGIVTGKSAGEATITVTSVLNKKNKTTFEVTVKSQDLVDTVVDPTGEAKIVLAENEVTLAPVSSFDTGRVSTYYAQVAADKNKEKYGQAQIKVSRVNGLSSSAVTYQSNNTSVAEVSSTGFVTPKRAGVAVITVSAKSNPNVTAEYRVMVKNLATYIKFQRFDKLRLEPDEYEKTSVYAVTPEGYRTYNLCFEIYPETADNKNYTVTSSDESVIQPKMNYDYGTSDCVLVLKKKGKATLTIKSDDGYVTEKWTIEVCNGDHLYGVGVQ
jgi:uncharacterized protein YjdB